MPHFWKSVSSSQESSVSRGSSAPAAASCCSVPMSMSAASEAGGRGSAVASVRGAEAWGGGVVRRLAARA